MTHLDTIDRKANPKEWIAELRRIDRERDVRLACLRIATRVVGEPIGSQAMLNFVRVSEPDNKVRLACLQLAGEFPIFSEVALIERAEKILAIVTEADNG